jgi:hypothetical protein
MKRRREKIRRNRKMELRRAVRKARRRAIVKDRRRRFITNECIRNCNLNKHRSKENKQYFEKKAFRLYKTRNAPSNFSIIDNHEEVIRFCNKLRNDYHRRSKVFVNLRDVKTVTNESLCLLLSNMMMFREKRISFDGNFPIDDNAKIIIIESGFFPTLYNNRNRSVNNVKSSIFTHSSNSSNADLVDEIIKSCSMFLWNEVCNCGGVYNAFMELMSNTIEHADEIEGRKKWWVTVTKDAAQKKVSFSFVDYGRGIIATLKDINHKHHKSIVESLLSKWHNDDARLLKDVMEGALKISEKGESQYGNGLNSIYQDMIDNNLNNIVIISNNVYADVKNDSYLKMGSNFPGTFISWEINQNTNHESICSDSVYS